MFGILLLWGLFLNGAATVIDQHGSTVLGCAGQAASRAFWQQCVAARLRSMLPKTGNMHMVLHPRLCACYTMWHAV